MWLIDRLEPPFVPLSLLACALYPLVDTALDLMTVGTRVKIRDIGRKYNPYHSEYEGDGRD